MKALFIWLPVGLVVAIAMDLWAAFLHGRVWHTWLWPVHASHHQRRNGAFEQNDALSVLHAPIAVALILYGCRASPGVLREVVFGVGVGMTAFGIAYVLVHDGVIHGRLPVRFLRRLRAMRALARAHRIHHSGAAGGAPYGLFLGPLELALSVKPQFKRGGVSAASSRAGGAAPTRRAPPAPVQRIGSPAAHGSSQRTRPPYR